MKKTLLVSTAVLGGLFVASTTAYAAPGPAVYDKQASVELVQKKDPELPYDGLLKLSNSFNLEFGKANIATTDTFLSTKVLDDKNKPVPPKEPQLLVVEDIRGEGLGWKLEVKLGEFKEFENNKPVENGKTLKGVELFYPNTQMTSEGTGDAPEIMTYDKDSFIKVPTARKGLIIPATNHEDGDNGAVLFNAKEGTGDGKWTADYDVNKNPIELKIAPGNKVGKYQSVLTYTLTDTPSI
ncbi:WxL domain-containing protein [Vagococcus silagei]|uniref:WxL domain-containing protein n=1 Tax=Vagococcus silagei TaxID=2508885 RepID=A0A4S3B3Z1_9ENTE|nr:WxL domain-containing protein [Vagococcus silagei]THB60106.1 hypothetical protein ESZ54_12175 [Vagococcus silagei]